MSVKPNSLSRKFRNAFLTGLIIFLPWARPSSSSTSFSACLRNRSPNWHTSSGSSKKVFSSEWKPFGCPRPFDWCLGPYAFGISFQLFSWKSFHKLNRKNTRQGAVSKHGLPFGQTNRRDFRQGKQGGIQRGCLNRVPANRLLRWDS